MTSAIDILWLLIASILVLSMQVGFLLLEAGRVRAKNSINVAQKNVSDLVVAWVAFFLFGYFLMTGKAVPLADSESFANGSVTVKAALDFIYLLGFCAAAASIVSGGVAERMTFRAYLLLSFVTGALLFPIVGRWIWGDTTGSWLASLGFVDFAGSTVVHGVGAWVALAAIVVLGPRLGRFSDDGELRPIAGHNSVIALTGALILLIGWFGFNAGALSVSSDQFAPVLLNTAVAATFGAVCGLVIGALLDDGKFNPPRVINGLLGGLVAITACAHLTTTVQAAMVGSLGGVAATLCAQWLMVRWRLDDPVDVVSVHGVAGVVGTMCVAFVGPVQALPAGSRLGQAMVQLLGVSVVFVFVFGAAWAVLRLYDRIWAVRVSADDEQLGLNYTEHGESVGTDRLRQALDAQNAGQFPLQSRLLVDDGDEASDLAHAMNQLLDRHDQARLHVRESEIRFQDFALTASDWLWETDHQLKLTYLSMSGDVQDLTRLADGDRPGLFQFAHVGGNEIALLRDAIRERDSFGPLDAHLVIPGLGDRLVAVRGRARYDEDGTYLGYRGTFNDVTERRSAERRANFLSRHDELTGLPNRRALSDDIVGMQRALPDRAAMAVVALDLDGFKKVNDAYGHSMGDELLKAVSVRMRKEIRDSDQLYRTGGDEFVLLLPNFSRSTVREDVQSLSAKFIESISKSYRVNGRSVDVGVSLGVALFPEHSASGDRLAHLADLALYAAKAAGKGCMVVFESEMDTDAKHQFEFERELRKAVLEEQFLLEYQPLHEGSDGRLIGFEALLRWDHPTRGKVAPADFIPVAERMRLMGELGAFAINEACAFASRFPPAIDGPPLRIAVNVSPSQFRDRQILRDVRLALSRTGLAPERLELEITEELLIGDFDLARDTLRELRDLGVSIAIDDFGSGQTSLQYLNRLPISKLKIDKAFVRNIDADDRAREITHSIVMLAHKLGCLVTAEGVEEKSQANILQQWQCDQMQGYMYSRPMPADKAMAMIGTEFVRDNDEVSATH